MLLLTMREHLFTGSHIGGAADFHTERTLAFATDLHLSLALRKIKAHEEAYRLRYKNMAAEFKLLGVVKLEEDSWGIREDLAHAGVQRVEDLQTTLQGFG